MNRLPALFVAIVAVLGLAGCASESACDRLAEWDLESRDVEADLRAAAEGEDLPWAEDFAACAREQGEL